jgi:hypothetical protein
MSRYRERRLPDAKSLKRTLEALDLDEGIRMRGNFPDFPSGVFLFVNKIGNEYRVGVTERVKDKRSNRVIPGNKQQWFTFPTFEQTWDFVKKHRDKNLDAWYY